MVPAVRQREHGGVEAVRQRARGCVAAAVVFPVLASCAVSTSESAPLVTTSATVTPATASATPITASPAAPEATGSTILDGVERTWRTYSPMPMRADSPILLVLHGSGGTGAGLRDAIGADIEKVADEHGFVVAYVDGYRNNWNECRVGGRWPAKVAGVDDVALMRHVVESIGTGGPVYAVGFSSGGHMAMRLALEASDLVGGVGVVAANPPVVGNQSCVTDGDPVPMMFVEGREDPINPLSGGEVRVRAGSSQGSRGEVLSAADGARWYARHNGVGTVPERGPERAGGVESTVWDGADPVRLVVLDDTGHTFPTASGGWGPSGAEPYDAPGEIWRFLTSG